MKRKQKSKDRGSSLVEFSIVIPVLLILLVGTIEFGLAWRESSNLSRSVGQGARTLASLGANGYSEYETLLTIRTSLGSNYRTLFNEGDYVIIYDASGSEQNAELRRLECEPLNGEASREIVVKQGCTLYPAYLLRQDTDVDGNTEQEDEGEIFEEDFRPFGWMLESYIAFEETQGQSLLNVGASNCALGNFVVKPSGVKQDIIYNPCERKWNLSEIQNINISNTPRVGLKVKTSYRSLTGFLNNVTLQDKAIYQVQPCGVRDSGVNPYSC